jgi:phenylacetate-CoA ligase
MQKADMQIPAGDRLSDEFNLKTVYINNTSGSSGVPLIFAKDKYCHARTWAFIQNRFGWHGINFNSSWQARFYGIPYTKIKYIKERIKDFLSRRVRFPVFNLEDSVCEKYVQKFTGTRFEYLNGYTSSLVLFAKYCIQKGIVLKDICPSLKVCVTTSEICDEIDRSVMEKGFGVKVVNEYGAAELDIIAFEDIDGNWLLNEENVFIEILDDNDNPVPDGQTGRVVVTGMFNKAMPFIRYELGDIASIEPGFRKGINRKLKYLEGRVNDIAILPSGKKVPGLTFYYVTKSLLDKGGKLKEFVIRQDSPSEFTIEYVQEELLSVEGKQKIREMMDLYLEPGLALHFQQKDKIERTKAGKLRQFQSLVNPSGK